MKEIYEVEWTEASFDGKERRDYSVKCSKKEMEFILENILKPITGIRIQYRIYSPNGTLIKRGKI